MITSTSAKTHLIELIIVSLFLKWNSIPTNLIIFSKYHNARKMLTVFGWSDPCESETTYADDHVHRVSYETWIVFVSDTFPYLENENDPFWLKLTMFKTKNGAAETCIKKTFKWTCNSSYGIEKRRFWRLTLKQYLVHDYKTTFIVTDRSKERNFYNLKVSFEQFRIFCF